MTASPSNWVQVTPSEYPWEQEGLDFVRGFLPNHEPYRAWSNFEFIAEDNSINEVDLLVATPKGLFLVELKAWSGEITGDAGQWLWTTTEGKRRTVDNPLLLANRKSKKLASLLKRQQKPSERHRIPFLTPLIFVSSENLRLRLLGNARHGICTRHTLQDALTQLEGANTHRRVDRPISKSIARAMDAAGIRETNRTRQVLNYELHSVLYESEHYQDWLGKHADMRAKRRVRIFQVHGKPEEEAGLLRQAARREAQVLEHLDHPGILRVQDYVEHELGPALIYEYAEGWQRLDHYLLEHSERLPFAADVAVDILRAIANTIRYAHDRKLYHRSLSPQCIYLTSNPLEGDKPQVKIGNWHAAERIFQRQTQQLTQFSGAGAVIAEDAGAYTALEAWATGTGTTDAQSVDVFSLGAIAYLLFTGEPPAASDIELQDKLHRGSGLQVSDAISGASRALQDLVQESTRPDATHRIDSVADFLGYVDYVEDELSRPDNLRTSDPVNARVGEQFEGGLTIKGWLGQGATAVAFLVEIDGVEQVLKLANSPEQNDRLSSEAATLAQLRHPNIVAHHKTQDVLGHTGVLIDYAEGKTLAARLRSEGSFGRELLQRLGDELLSAVCHLEEFGIAHRDIKPENIGLTIRRNHSHLLLFDFSLSQEPVENYRVGTAAYLDPYLREPGRERWDLYAERYATALTLFEMAAGALPPWAQQLQLPPYGQDDQLELDATVFDASLREPLTLFFRQALARKLEQRFDNSTVMRDAWRVVFEQLAANNTQTAKGAEVTSVRVALAEATVQTAIGLLALDDAVLDTLTRLNVNTVQDFLSRPKNEFQFLTGVGTKTRRAISDAYDRLRSQLKLNPVGGELSNEGDKTSDGILSATPGIEALLRNVAPTHIKSSKRADQQRNAFLCALLGHELAEDERQADVIYWPDFQQVCDAAGVDTTKGSELYKKRLALWTRNKHVKQLREDIQQLLEANGGIMTARELADALLLRRGSTAVSPWREWHAEALMRVAVETELDKQARWVFRRHGVDATRVIIALNSVMPGEIAEHDEVGDALADYAVALGNAADMLAATTLEGDAIPPFGAQIDVMLQAIAPPIDGFTLPAGRLIPLAVAASEHAAISSRGECYRRGMPAIQALQLAQNALLGARQLSVKEVQRRVHGRYPQAQLLPARPQLDGLMWQLELGFDWYPAQGRELGYYALPEMVFGGLTTWVSTLSGATALGSTTGSYSGPSSQASRRAAAPQQALIEQFDKQLQQTLATGRFLAISVRPARLDDGLSQLAERYGLAALDVDELLVSALKEKLSSLANPPRWEVLLEADAQPAGSRDRNRLERLIREVLPQVQTTLEASNQPVLLYHPGLLARYGLVNTWLAELRRQFASENKPLLLLVGSDAGGNQALIDDTPVPGGAGNPEYARLPTQWLVANAV